jgi:hypothetical protein
MSCHEIEASTQQKAPAEETSVTAVVHYETEYYVHYRISIDDVPSEILPLQVRSGEKIDSIKRKIMNRHVKFFVGADETEVKFFTTPNEEISLKALDKWSPHVEWGTETAPLFIKSSQSIGMYFYC